MTKVSCVDVFLMASTESKNDCIRGHSHRTHFCIPLCFFSIIFACKHFTICYRIL